MELPILLSLAFFSGIDWLKHMARKPNYRFERHEREKAKAAKKAAKTEAKAQKRSDASPDDQASDQQLVPTEGNET